MVTTRRRARAAISGSLKKAAFVVGVMLLLLFIIYHSDDSYTNNFIQPQQIVVRRGDTLWAIARRIAPEQDPRRVVDTLRQLNELETAIIHEGQVLTWQP